MRERRRVIVTGGAGFIGRHLCERLLQAGNEVVCLDDLSTGSSANLEPLLAYDSFTFIHHDVVYPFPDLGTVDLVAHLACPPSPRYYMDHPVQTIRTAGEGTRHALDVASAYGARILIASTSEVYGNPECHPQHESYWGNVNPIGPRSPYDEGKRYAEAMACAYAAQYGTNVGVARIFNTYGPGMRADDGRMIPTFIGQALDGKALTVFGTGSQTRSLCYVDDTVEGLLAVAESDERDPINIGNPHELTVSDVAREILRLVGAYTGVEHLPGQIDDPVRRCPDIGRAADRLDWAPRAPLALGLQQTITWFVGQRQPMPTTDRFGGAR